MTPRNEHQDIEPDSRQGDVLREVVRQHIQSGEPVGSASVTRGARFELSPASVRSVMAELEERGLLVQPHKSAGRIPTDRAYRVYVDRLIRKPRMAATEADAIERALAGSRGEPDELFLEASRQLSRFSQRVALVLAPDLQQLVVDHIEFVRLDAGRVMAIVVARSGTVQNRILAVPQAPEPAELERMGRYLTREFVQHTLHEMRAALERSLGQERAAYDRLALASLELGRRALDRDPEVELFVEGASNLLSLPDFSDLDLLRALLRTLEDKRTLIELLNRLIESTGVRVVIGEESPLFDLTRCSLVASTYGADGRVLGTVGVVGPTRMHYGRAMALVDHLSRVLSQKLGSSDN